MEIILIIGRYGSGKTHLANSLAYSKRSAVTLWLQSYRDDLISQLRPNIETIIVEGALLEDKRVLINLLKSFPLILRKPYRNRILVNPSTIIITTQELNYELKMATQTIITKR